MLRRPLFRVGKISLRLNLKEKSLLLKMNTKVVFNSLEDGVILVFIPIQELSKVFMSENPTGGETLTFTRLRENCTYL